MQFELVCLCTRAHIWCVCGTSALKCVRCDRVWVTMFVRVVLCARLLTSDSPRLHISAFASWRRRRVYATLTTAATSGTAVLPYPHLSITISFRHLLEHMTRFCRAYLLLSRGHVTVEPEYSRGAVFSASLGLTLLAQRCASFTRLPACQMRGQIDMMRTIRARRYAKPRALRAVVVSYLALVVSL